MSYFVTVSDAVRDHFLDPVNLRWLQVIIDPDDAALTLTPVEFSCDAGHDYQRWGFRIKNRDTYSVGQNANEPAIVQFSHNGSDWVTCFTGFVADEGFRRSRGLITDDHISFELHDATRRRGTRRKPDPVLLAGFKICDPANTAASILHYLAGLMGAEVNASEIDYSKTLLELGTNSAWEELQKLREAFHADMFFDADGDLLFATPFDTDYSAPSSEWTFQGDPDNAVSGAACRIYGILDETYLPVRCNYAKASIEELVALAEQVVYKNTENLSTLTDLISIEVPAGEYWPGPNATDLAKLYYQDPESGEKFPYAISVGTPSIGAAGSGSGIEHTGGTIEIISFNGSSAATSAGADHSQIILRNTGAGTATIRKLTLTGSPYRNKGNQTIECIDAAVADAIDYVEHEIDGKYATSASQVYDALYHIREEGKGRPRQFYFSAPFMPWIQRAAIVSVQPPGEAVARCRIDSYRHLRKGRTLQGATTAIVCTELAAHTPSGSPRIQTGEQISPILAKIMSISPNAGATYRSEAASAPSIPRLGDLWYQTDTHLMKRYSGSSWENTGASPLEESESAGVAFETASGKVQILDDGTIKAIDGEFSGTVSSTDIESSAGQLGSFISARITGSAQTFTSTDTIQDFVDHMTGLTPPLSKYGGSMIATYGGKTYTSYEREEKDDVRSIGYKYTYYFHASDGTKLTYEDDDNFPGDFEVLGVFEDAEVLSLLVAPVGIDTTAIKLPLTGGITFEATAGSTAISDRINGNLQNTYTAMIHKLYSAISGTVRINYIYTNSTAGTLTFDLRIYVDAVLIATRSQAVTAGNSHQSYYDLTIYPSEVITFQRRTDTAGGGSETSFQVWGSVDGAISGTARATACVKVEA